MFLGIFHRQKPLLLEKDNLKGSAYYPYKEELKASIIEARQIKNALVTIKSYDNLNLVGRYYDKNSETTIVLVHGFQSNAFNNFSSILKYYLSSGFNVLMIDQRAHGMSKGHFTTTACKEKYDLLNWIEWLENNTNCSNIFIHGVSMGAATIGLASDKINTPKVKGLIMEAGFTSFYDELWFSFGNFFMKKAAMNYILLCTKYLLKIDIKETTVKALSKNKIPVLFMHGNCDTEVPITHTKESFLACNSDKYLIIIEDAPHTLCHLIEKETVENKIKEFIIKYQTRKKKKKAK